MCNPFPPEFQTIEKLSKIHHGEIVPTKSAMKFPLALVREELTYQNQTSSSDLCAIYTELEDATPVASVVMKP